VSPHVLPVQVYYEDTDHSGVVYHANYLKYFERAREHLLGVEELVRLWQQDQVGFVVYQCSMKFREGARFGDTLEVRTTVQRASDYRAVFTQEIWRPQGARAMVEGEVHLCCVDGQQQLVRLPATVLAMVASRFPV